MTDKVEGSRHGPSFNDSLLTFATPGRKRRERYDDANPFSKIRGSAAIDKRGSMSKVSSLEEELVINPSQDSQDLTEKRNVLPTSSLSGSWW